MPPTPHPLHVSSPRPRWPGLSFLHQQAPHPIPAEITTTHRWGSLPASGWAQTGVGLGASLPCGRGGQERDSQHPPRPTKGGLSPSHHPHWPEEVSELIRKPQTPTARGRSWDSGRPLYTTYEPPKIDTRPAPVPSCPCAAQIVLHPCIVGLTAGGTPTGGWGPTSDKRMIPLSRWASAPGSEPSVSDFCSAQQFLFSEMIFWGA